MEEKPKQKKFLLDMDLNAILDQIPQGSTITVGDTPGRTMPGRGMPLHRKIVKSGPDTFVETPSNKPYPKTKLYNDISNQRVHISDLIAMIEKHGNALSNAEIDEKTGHMYVYNATIENVKSEPHLNSDALILFLATFTSEEIKEQNILLEDAPIKLSQYVYDKITSDSQTKRMNGHHYSQEMLLDIKEHLDHPLAVIKTKTKDGGAAIAVLTGAKDYKGDLTLVIMAPDKERHDNYITSMYGKEYIVPYLTRQREAGNIAYINPEIKKQLQEKLSEQDMQTLTDLLQDIQKEQMQAKTTMKSIQSIVQRKRGGKSK